MISLIGKHRQDRTTCGSARAPVLIHLTRLTAAIIVTALLIAVTGCIGTQTAATGSTLDQLPTILPALSPDLQNAAIEPQLVWLKQDSRFGAWGTQPVSDGWIAGGQYYGAGSEGQGARLEYYNKDGSLRWSYQRPLNPLDSCYVCAARRTDGSVITGGRISNENDPGDPSFGLLTAFDAAGQILWEQKIDYPADKNIGLTVTRCLSAADGRILVVLDSDLYFVSIREGRHPTILACFSAEGQPLWQKEIDFSGMAYSQAAILDDDGGFYLAVYGFRTDTNQMSQGFSWLLRLGRDGNEIWRKNLNDERYQYQATGLTRDGDGNLLLSCSARYLGEIPDPPASPAAFHDRYRSYAYHPAALLKLDPAGGLIWQKFVNGEFGATGQDVLVAGEKIYWKVRLTDDIVKPYIFMSMDHRAIGHEVIALLDLGGSQIRYYPFSQAESASLQIQRIDEGQPVLIGWEPIPENPAWTETLADD